MPKFRDENHQNETEFEYALRLKNEHEIGTLDAKKKARIEAMEFVIKNMHKDDMDSMRAVLLRLLHCN